MGVASVRLDPAFAVGPLNRRIFGTFVEHMGRCVYTGIHEPGHPTADAARLPRRRRRPRARARADDRALPRRQLRLQLPLGGRGRPQGGPPTKLDLAWRSIETNQVGTDDFLAWAPRLGIEPMLAVNLGTRGLTEAIELLQYCNAEAGIELSDRRVKQRPPRAARRARLVPRQRDGRPVADGPQDGRGVRPSRRGDRPGHEALRRVASSSSPAAPPTGRCRPSAPGSGSCSTAASTSSTTSRRTPTTSRIDGDVDSFLACAEDMDRFIRAVVATADHVAAAKGSDKRISVSFDEWNVWFQARFDGESSLEIREAPRAHRGRLLVTDAVVVGSLLITLMQHTDRVSMACQAQLVNVIAPIIDPPGWPRLAAGDLPPVRPDHAGMPRAPSCGRPSSRRGRDHGLRRVDQLLTTATLDPETGDLVVFAVNRSRQPKPLDLTRQASAAFGKAAQLDRAPVPPRRRPERTATPRPTRSGSCLAPATPCSTAHPAAVLPPISWHCFRLSEGNNS